MLIKLIYQSIAGIEAFGQLTNIYNSFKQAIESSIPNATTTYNKLIDRFEAQGNTAGRNTNTT